MTKSLGNTIKKWDLCFRSLRSVEQNKFNFIRVFLLFNYQLTSVLLNNDHALHTAVFQLGKILIVPGFRIRIHFLRIRIQRIRMGANTDPDTDPDPIRIQGFNGQKLKKITAEKKE